MDRAGQVIEGKYRLLRLLGEGGMGTVYEARHILLDRRCAVKFVHPEIAREPETIGRFLREAKAASAIGHAGIVEVYDVGQLPDGTPFLVMEYLQGQPLAAVLAGGRRLPPAQAAEIVVRALLALAAAHRIGVIHRDLKPDNLIVDFSAPGVIGVKILDFGICRMDQAAQAGPAMTRPGAILGTPYYMAPEQASAARDIDHRLDLYAMGVIFYECVTGRLPFQAPDIGRMIFEILGGTFPLPTAIDPRLPRLVDEVVQKAMARERERRYGSAEEMMRALLPLVPPAVLAQPWPGGSVAQAAGGLPAGGPAGGAAGPATRTCPKCGRQYDLSYRFCPVDAVRLDGEGGGPPDEASPAAFATVAEASSPHHPPPALRTPTPAPTAASTTAFGAQQTVATPGAVRAPAVVPSQAPSRTQAPPLAGAGPAAPTPSRDTDRSRLPLVVTAVVLALGIAGVVLYVVATRKNVGQDDKSGRGGGNLIVALPAPDAGAAGAMPPPGPGVTLAAPPTGDGGATPPPAVPEAGTDAGLPSEAAVEPVAVVDPHLGPDGGSAESASSAPGGEPSEAGSGAPDPSADAGTPEGAGESRVDARDVRTARREDGRTTERDEGSSTAEPPDVAAPAGPSPEDVRRVMESIRPEVDDCLGGAGQASVRVTIAGRLGRVTGASVSGVTGYANTCITLLVKRLQFPPFAAQSQTVNYTYRAE
ncbi:MAG: protein kinase [Deltaproteobacteria bacterium]|nr:protein kinase [Deltaproteobacteria bacterium]